tara:strand:+ start:111 stop:371 length:261 start_codon:yes stop_codon:yes gene_type:complete
LADGKFTETNELLADTASKKRVESPFKNPAAVAIPLLPNQTEVNREGYLNQPGMRIKWLASQVENPLQEYRNLMMERGCCIWMSFQ